MGVGVVVDSEHNSGLMDKFQFVGDSMEGLAAPFNFKSSTDKLEGAQKDASAAAQTASIVMD